jgi:hypothetical protein
VVRIVPAGLKFRSGELPTCEEGLSLQVSSTRSGEILSCEEDCPCRPQALT